MRRFHGYSLIAALLAVCSPAFAAVREVGSGQPYTTIQACINAAVGGDVCNVHAGTYNEQLRLTTSGSSGGVITLSNNGSDVVTVQSPSSPVLDISGKSYWTIDGINFTYNGSGSDPAVINSTNGAGNVNYVTVNNSTITVAGGNGEGFGMSIYTSDHLTVSNCTIHISASTGSHDGADFMYASNLNFSGNTVYGNASESSGKLEDGLVVSGTNLNIENNTMHDGWSYDNHPDGIVIQGDGDRNGNHTANVTVRRNTLYNFTQLVYFDAIHNPLEGNNLIYDNVLYENSNFRYGGASNKVNGIVLDGESLSGSAGYPVSVRVYNNTIDAHQLHLYVLRLGSGSNIDIENNIFVNPPYTALMVSSTSGVTLNNNYYSQGDNNPIRWGSNALTLVLLKALGLEGNARTGNANLNADYTPKATSDSNDHGVSLASFFTVDKIDVSRPKGGAWDMGAYEYASGVAAAPQPPTNLQVQVH
jgi:hypothetical protein